MRASLTIITATIPGREESLGRTIASVFNQTVEVEAHLIMAQSITEGLPQPLHAAKQQNWPLPSVRSEWVARLADDLADVIYSWDAHHNRPRFDCAAWSSERIAAELMTHNWIEGSAVAIRTELFRQVGGWPENWATDRNPHGFGGYYEDMWPVCCDDWGASVRLARAGARFVCIPKETWAFGYPELRYHQ
jgi:hypothetical protein